MKFLFVSDFEEAPDSGAAGTLISIGRSLVERGHYVDFVWRDRTPYVSPHVRVGQFLELPHRQMMQVERRLQDRAYDVVSISQPYAYLVYERLAVRYPKTVFVNRTHGWEERLDIVEANAAEGPYAFGGSWSLVRRASARARARACSRTALAASGVITAASSDGTFVVERYGAPSERVAVIPYGLDDEYRDLPPRTMPREAGRRLLFVGVYVPRKGTRILEATLLDAVRVYPDARVTFVVPDDCTEQVEATYRAVLGDRLSISPWQSRRQLRQVYDRHDVLLFPSLFEGFGKVALEAMASGLCVVGFDEAGLSDVASPDREAVTCRLGDVAGYREALDRVLRCPDMARAIGARAMDRVQAFTWARTADATEQFCARLREMGPR